MRMCGTRWAATKRSCSTTHPADSSASNPAATRVSCRDWQRRSRAAGSYPRRPVPAACRVRTKPTAAAIPAAIRTTESGLGEERRGPEDRGNDPGGDAVYEPPEGGAQWAGPGACCLSGDAGTQRRPRPRRCGAGAGAGGFPFQIRLRHQGGRSDVQALVKGLSDHLAPRSLRNVYDTLNRVLTAAVDDRLIPRTPCTRITLPAVPDCEVEAPTAEQVHALADAVAPRYRGLVVLLAGSGLRIGEALGLGVAGVDFLRRTVRVERQRLQDGTVGPTKTAKSTRTVPLGAVVVDELAAHLAAYGAGEWLFTTPMGEPLSYRRWKVEWNYALRSTGLTLTTHSLRHFTASALIAGGASVKSVQTVLGHSSAAITLRVYSHLWPGDEDRTRSVLDAALTAPADQVRTNSTL